MQDKQFFQTDKIENKEDPFFLGISSFSEENECQMQFKPLSTEIYAEQESGFDQRLLKHGYFPGERRSCSQPEPFLVFSESSDSFSEGTEEVMEEEKKEIESPQVSQQFSGSIDEGTVKNEVSPEDHQTKNTDQPENSQIPKKKTRRRRKNLKAEMEKTDVFLKAFLRSLKKFLRDLVDQLGLGKDKYKQQNYLDRHRRILVALASELGFDNLSVQDRAKLALLTFSTMGKRKPGKHLPEVKTYWEQMKDAFYESSNMGNLGCFEKLVTDKFGKKVLLKYIETQAFADFEQQMDLKRLRKWIFLREKYLESEKII